MTETLHRFACLDRFMRSRRLKRQVLWCIELEADETSSAGHRSALSIPMVRVVISRPRRSISLRFVVRPTALGRTHGFPQIPERASPNPKMREWI